MVDIITGIAVCADFILFYLTQSYQPNKAQNCKNSLILRSDSCRIQSAFYKKEITCGEIRKPVGQFKWVKKIPAGYIFMYPL
jgi:predicted RNA-binding Zn-ribbon protein involved in translation (DUF1610 family)